MDDLDVDDFERELDHELEDRDRWAEDDGMRFECWA